MQQLHAAAHVGHRVEVVAERAGGAEAAAAEHDEGGDAPERELGDEVGARAEEGRAGAGAAVLDDAGGHERGLELAAEEAQREVGEAQAEGRARRSGRGARSRWPSRRASRCL
jgi:hypothetical protein